MSIISEFRDFALRGNVLDLAVAFVMGAAFNSVVTALVSDIVTPIIAIPGHVDFNSIAYTVNGSTILIGPFINALIAFLTIAVAVFFFIVKPVSRIKSSMEARKAPAAAATKACPYCMSVIPKNATRCPECTSHLKKR